MLPGASSRLARTLAPAGLAALATFAVIAAFPPGAPRPSEPEEPGGAPPAPAEAEAVAPSSCARPSDGLAVIPVDGARGSSVVLARTANETIALVADADTHRLHTVDVGTMRELAVTTLEGSPSAVLVLPSGRVAVALRDTSAISFLDFQGAVDQPLATACSIDVAEEPVALAAAGEDLFVASRWAATVSVLGLPSGDDGPTRIAEIPVSRDPAALAVSRGALFVLHASGGDLDRIALEGLREGRSPDVRTRTIAATRDGALAAARPAGAKGAQEAPRRATQGFALAASPEGVVHAALVLADPSPPQNADEPGGYGSENPMGEHVLTVSSGGERARLDPAFGADCPLPRDAVVDRAGRLLVACAGSDLLLTAQMQDTSIGEVQRHLVGSGPTGVAVDPETGRAFVWSAFDGVLTAASPVGLETDLGEELRVHHLAAPPVRPRVNAVALRRAEVLDPRIARGRVFFHRSSSAVSADGRACASCHPDGRDDGLTWATPEGPRQTPMLLGRIDGTAPYGWNGDQSLPGHFDRTIRRLSGQGFHADDRDAIFAYLKSLPVPGARALAAHGAEGELVQRGRDVFDSTEAQCGTCHVAGVATDGVRHDVGSGLAPKDTKLFDTPSLRFIGKSAPYYHDGRFATLDDLLRGSDHAMGKTSHLSDADRAALLAYLRSL